MYFRTNVNQNIKFKHKIEQMNIRNGNYKECILKQMYIRTNAYYNKLEQMYSNKC